MKNTNPIFSLKNFRSFGEEGADFELAPITVLTGRNSSGKSSMVKALILLSKQLPLYTKVSGKIIRFINNIPQYILGKPVIERLKPTEGFNVSFEELGLGNFDKILNQYAKNGEMILSYQIWSEYLQEYVMVKRTFEAHQGILNEGRLLNFSIEKLDGTPIWRYFWDGGKWGEYYSLDTISDKCNKLIVAAEYFDREREVEDCTEIYQKMKYEVEKKGLVTIPTVGGDSVPADDYLRKSKRELDDMVERKQYLEKKYGKDKVEEYCLKLGEKIMNDWTNRFFPYHELKNGKTDVDNVERLKETHGIERIQSNFINFVINECVAPWFVCDVAYIDSSSAIVKRLHTVKGDNKMCVALGQMANDGTTKDYVETGDFVNKWLKEFEIADKIRVYPAPEGIGVMVYCVKGEGENEVKRLLADEGYGITQLVSLFLQIENYIKKHDVNKTRLDDFFATESEKNKYQVVHSRYLIAIEEPEIHLHPAYQSKLADMFVEAYQIYNIHFIIETHSEYLIRKLQVLVADKENELTPNDVSLNYVDKDESGISTNRKIGIREDGSLDGTFGKGFYDEADSLAMELFRRKPILS